jgi:hypothetical protein
MITCLQQSNPESIAEGLQEDGIVTIGKWGTYSAEDL